MTPTNRKYFNYGLMHIKENTLAGKNRVFNLLMNSHDLQ